MREQELLNVPLCGVSVCLSTIVLAGDLGGGLGFLAIVLEGDLDLNSCLFYYWQTNQVGNNP